MRPVVVVVAVVVAIAFLSPNPVASDPVRMKPSIVAGAYESLRKKSVGPPHRKTDGAIDTSTLAINSTGGHKKALPSGNPLPPKPRLPTRPDPVTEMTFLPKQPGLCGSGQYLSESNGMCLWCNPAGRACKEPGCCCPGSKKIGGMCIGISCREGEKNCTKCEKDNNCLSGCCRMSGEESVAVCKAKEVCDRQSLDICKNNTIRGGCTNPATPSYPPVHPKPRPLSPQQVCDSDDDCGKNHCCCKDKCVPCEQKSKMNCFELCKVDRDCGSGQCCSPKNKCRKCSKMECLRVFNSSDLITLVTSHRNTCDEINSYDEKCVLSTGTKLICQMLKGERKCLFPSCPADKKCAGCAGPQNCQKGECRRKIKTSPTKSIEVCVPCASAETPPPAAGIDQDGRSLECTTNGDCEENKCCKKGVCSTCEAERDVDVPTAKSGDGGCIVGRDCPPHACCAKRENSEKFVCRKCGKESGRAVRCDRDSDCAGGECCSRFGLGFFCAACPTPPVPVHPTYASCKANQDCSPNSCCTRMLSSPTTKSCLPRPQTGDMCIVESSRFARYSCSCEGKHVQCVSSATKQRANFVGTCTLQVPEKPSRERKTKEPRDARNKKLKSKSSRRKNDRKSKKSN